MLSFVTHGLQNTSLVEVYFLYPTTCSSLEGLSIGDMFLSECDAGIEFFVMHVAYSSIVSIVSSGTMIAYVM
jgi:hypothetical protein